MKILNKNLSIIFSFLFYGLANCNPFAEQISDSCLSKDIEYEIKELLCDIKIPEIKDTLKTLNNETKTVALDLLSISHKLPIIRKTSQALAEHDSSFTIGGFYQKYNYLYVHEDFFKQLTPSEKKYWLLDTLDSAKLQEDNIGELSNINTELSLSKAYFWLSPIFCYLAYRSNFKSDIKAGLISGGAVLGIFGMFGYLINIIKLGKYKYERTRSYIDKVIVDKYNCLNEAISFFEKVINNFSLLSLNNEQIKGFEVRLDDLKKIKV